MVLFWPEWAVHWKRAKFQWCSHDKREWTQHMVNIIWPWMITFGTCRSCGSHPNMVSTASKSGKYFFPLRARHTICPLCGLFSHWLNASSLSKWEEPPIYQCAAAHGTWQFFWAIFEQLQEWVQLMHLSWGGSCYLSCIGRELWWVLFVFFMEHWGGTVGRTEKDLSFHFSFDLQSEMGFF